MSFKVITVSERLSNKHMIIMLKSFRDILLVNVHVIVFQLNATVEPVVILMQESRYTVQHLWIVVSQHLYWHFNQDNFKNEFRVQIHVLCLNYF